MLSSPPNSTDCIPFDPIQSRTLFRACRNIPYQLRLTQNVSIIFNALPSATQNHPATFRHPSPVPRVSPSPLHPHHHHHYSSLRCPAPRLSGSPAPSSFNIMTSTTFNPLPLWNSLSPNTSCNSPPRRRTVRRDGILGIVESSAKVPRCLEVSPWLDVVVVGAHAVDCSAR